MKKIFTLVLALCMIMSLAACGQAKPAQETPAPAATATQPEAPAETQPEPEEKPVQISGVVNVYSCTNEEATLLIKEMFEEKYPDCTLNYVTLGGGEIATRVEAEAANPQADFIFCGGCENAISLKNKGLLYSYASPSTADYSDINHDPDWFWTAIVNSYLGFYCDKDWFEANGIELPTSWNDLLDERLSDQIILTNPGTSTTGYMVLSTIVQLMGEEEGLAYFTELNKNVKSYASGGSGPSQSVALGEAAVGIGYMQHGLRLINEGYTNMVITAPEEGTGFEISSMAIVNNCKNLDAAKALMDLAASYEYGSRMAEKIGSTMTASGASTEDYLAFSDTKLLQLDYSWASENHDRLVGEWDKITSN